MMTGSTSVEYAVDRGQGSGGRGQGAGVSIGMIHLAERDVYSTLTLPSP
jgi:hypothetical protein